MSRGDVRVEWRATITKPIAHDGEWRWRIERREVEEMPGGGSISQWQIVKSVSARDAAGSAPTSELAKQEAKAAKDWYALQELHNRLPSTEEVAL